MATKKPVKKAAKAKECRVLINWDSKKRGSPEKAAKKYGLKMKLILDPYDTSPFSDVLFYGNAVKVFELTLWYDQDAIEAIYHLVNTEDYLKGRGQ